MAAALAVHSAALKPAGLGTDRDAFTPCIHVVGDGLSLVETSCVSIDNRSGLPTNNFPEFLVRLGVDESLAWWMAAGNSFILEATTPAYGDVFGTSPVATFVAGWEPAGDWRLDGAIRYARAEGLVDWFSRWTPSVVLRVPVADRWEVHAEWLGNQTAGLSDDTYRPFFSPGTHWVLTDRVEIGARVGWGSPPRRRPASPTPGSPSAPDDQPWIA